MGGATVALAPALWLTDRTGSPLLLASVAGTAVFVFSLTEAPAAQPRPVVLAHLGCAAIGVTSWQWLGPGLAALLCGALASLVFMVAIVTSRM